MARSRSNAQEMYSREFCYLLQQHPQLTQEPVAKPVKFRQPVECLPSAISILAFDDFGPADVEFCVHRSDLSKKGLSVGRCGIVGIHP